MSEFSLVEPVHLNPTLDDHLISVQWPEIEVIPMGAVIEATGLYLDAFVENHELHDRMFEYSFECASPHNCIIRAHLRLR